LLEGELFHIFRMMLKQLEEVYLFNRLMKMLKLNK